MTNKSSDQLLESVSALVDNAASELEMRRILKHVGSDDEVRERWRRYHIIGSVMRREQGVASEIDISLAVASAISGEESPVDASMPEDPKSPQVVGHKFWKELLGKSAVAASFAAVLVLGFTQYGPGSNQVDTARQLAGDEGLQADIDRVASSAPLGFDLPRPEARTVSNAVISSYVNDHDVRVQMARQNDDLTDVATQNLLNHLLIEHAERASVNGSLGILPFARVSKMNDVPRQR